MRADRCLVLLLLVCRLLWAPESGSAQTLIATVPTGFSPVAVAINSATNKMFVANQDSNSVTVIDGLSNATATVAVGSSPVAVAVNPVTNMIYVANAGGNAAVTVVDGATYSAMPIVTGQTSPVAIAVNSVTNRVYVANQMSNTVSVIDGSTNSVLATLAVGSHPHALAINVTTNKAYVANMSDGSVTVISWDPNKQAFVTSTVPTNGYGPEAVTLNPVTNRVYVANLGDGVSVIDGNRDSLMANISLASGATPCAIAANPATNKIYVSDFGNGTVSVIDGSNNGVTQVAVGGAPGPLTVAAITNKIFVASFFGSVIMLDGNTDSVAGSLQVGYYPNALAINPFSNTIYVVNQESYTVSVVAGASAAPLQFVHISPCRLLDTRPQFGGAGPIQAGTFQNFTLQGKDSCGDTVPGPPAAYSLNVTVVPGGPLGYLTVWPAGQDRPIVSTLNSFDGRVKANAAIVPAGAGGAISVYATNTTDLVLDIDGYFAPASGSTLEFYVLPPCRVADTRNPPGDLGGPYLQGRAPGRPFPILEASACNIPSAAQAYSLNFTAVPHEPLAYLTVWPTGQDRPLVSTLNAPTGTVTANAAIVPAGTGGNISVYALDDTDLIIDINGYFAAPGGGLALYPVAPCRVLDTRFANGQFSGQLYPPVNVVGTPCGVGSAARAFVLNATVVPPGPLAYLTLWPDGDSRPLVSTLNSFDGAVASNMAIVPTHNGSIDAYALNTTQLILDSFSYFGP